MTLREAIKVRKSRRKYIAKSIDSSLTEEINAIIKKHNTKSGLNMQLITNNGDAFNGFRKSYGLFSNVQNCIALIGKSSDENIQEKSGYYGEFLVLEATKLGLGTCWIGGSFDRTSSAFKLNKDEALVCVIAVGNVDSSLSLKEKLIQKMAGQKSIPTAQLFSANVAPPNEFLNAITCVSQMPSAKMQMPIIFQYCNGKASVSITKTTGYEFVDLGIAKAHFEIGFGAGSWSWGDNAEFEPENA